MIDEPHDGLAQTVASGGRRRACKEDLPERPAKLVANVQGFSLEAGCQVHENDRDGLEWLVRYCARPRLAMDRVTEAGDGSIVIKFKKALFDASTEVRPSPAEFLRRLAAIVPRPTFHLSSAHGVFARRLRACRSQAWRTGVGDRVR